MKISKLAKILFSLAFMMCALSVFAEVNGQNTAFEVYREDVSGASLQSPGYVMPDTTAKPPLSVKDNSAELSDAATVVFSNGGTSEYVIICKSGQSASVAYTLSEMFNAHGKAYVDFKTDTEIAQTEKEILVGDTGRAISTELVALVEAAATSAKA